MRDTKTDGWFVQNSSGVPVRALRVAAVALAVGFVMMTGAARAQEDDDDDKTFEQKIIEGVIAGVGGTNLDNGGIDYRERSPLVVPPRLDLPPPASTAAEAKAPPNWPKDPDVARRKAYVAARKKEKFKEPWEAGRPLSPSELNVGKTAAASTGTGTRIEAPPPGEANPLLSPSQLGYNGGLSGLFGGNKPEEAPFTGEPTRDSLTQPPAGYQTPSPNFAYGTGPTASVKKQQYDASTGKVE